MAEIRKFMFERSFEGEDAQTLAAHERRQLTLSPEQVEAIKKEAYIAGVAAAKKAAGEDQTQRLNMTVEKIGSDIASLLQLTEAERQQKETRVREAVLAIARKILPDYNQRHGLQEIEAVVAGIVGEMANEPRLVVRVNEGQFDTIDGSLKSVTEKQGYAGKIVLLADPEVRINDCRIEWADGGIERNLEALWENIGQSIAPDSVIPENAVPENSTAPEAPTIQPDSSETATQEIKNG